MDALEQARRTGTLHLNDLGLDSVPPQVFELTNLVRLDLGYNELTTLPADIGRLTALEQLWLNSNPLEEVPPELQHCRRLRVLDLRDTRLTTVPREIGRLQSLAEIDLSGVDTLKPKLRAAAAAPEGVLATLHVKDVRKDLKLKLFTKLRDGHYREECGFGSDEGRERLWQLVKGTCRLFQDLDELRNVLRNAERLFPATMARARPEAVRRVFDQLRKANYRKKLSAELELKIRAIYYDRIDPSVVEGMVASIYNEVHDLEDVEFLIKHSAQLFPEAPDDVDGTLLYNNVLELQQAMAEERAAAFGAVLTAAAQIYNDVEPALVRQFCEEVCVKFKKVEDLKMLAADAVMHFPAELRGTDPAVVKRSFVRQRREAEATA